MAMHAFSSRPKAAGAAEPVRAVGEVPVRPVAVGPSRFAHDFSRLPVSVPGDWSEREADRMAERVLSGPRYEPSPIGEAVRPHPPAMQPLLPSPGRPLDPQTRAFMEPRFGRDFDAVRVHAGDAAAASARNLHARAYTVGPSIVLGADAPSADTPGGRRLMAHELAHVVQQADGLAAGIQRQPAFGPQPVVMTHTNYRFDTFQLTGDDLSDPEVLVRFNGMTRPQLREYRKHVTNAEVLAFIDSRLAQAPPLERKETRGAPLNRQNMKDLAPVSYWEQKVRRVYSDRPDARLTGKPEERDAVYAAILSVRPSGAVTGLVRELVTIPPSAERKNALLYELTFTPPAKAGDRPDVEIRFLQERPGTIEETAAEPPKEFTPVELEFTTEVNVPDNYWSTHAEEKRQIAYWVSKQAGTFRQLVVTKVQPAGGKGPVRETPFFLRGAKDKSGRIIHLDIEKVARPREAAPPDDYRNRDYGDLLLEEQQSQPHATKGDKLGHVNLSGVPPEERFSVNYTILRYFRDVGTRNAEVDAIVPIDGSNKEVYYNIRFRRDNEVDVERVGEKGSTPKLDPNRLDIARARGYDEAAADPAKLKTWLGKRYPGVKPKGTTVEELRTSANEAMTAGVSTAPWYASNYKISVLGGAAMQSRLRGTHKNTARQTPDAEKKDFTAPELTLFELTLQTFTETILKMIRFIRLGRRTLARNADGTEHKTTGGGTVGAQTFRTGSERSIVIYDAGFRNGPAHIFHGGAEGVNDPNTLLLAHEFGHSIEATGARRAFNKFVKKAGIQPFTAYAASDPDDEFYPEAFALYQTDPEWLRRNHLEVYLWLDELNRTGKVPKVK